MTEILINRKFPGINPVDFGYEDCEPGHFFGPAVRTYWLLHYVQSGCGIFRRNGNEYSVEPGELFVIPPYEKTFYQADAQNPWKYGWVGFTAEMELPELLQKPVIHRPEAGRVFSEMRRCGKFTGGKEAFLLGKIWELLSLFWEENIPAPDYVQLAEACMESEYMNGITVAEIAGRLGLDRSYFSSLFREARGISPQQYLVNLRLEKAAELMVRFGQTPSTVAISTGYSDVYNFSRMFKKHFGLSPRDYIREQGGE